MIWYIWLARLDKFVIRTDIRKYVHTSLSLISYQSLTQSNLNQPAPVS